MPCLDGLLSFRKPWVNDPALDAVLQFRGLLYAIGGRSLTWGGWGPEPLHDNQNDELVDWPNASITDLQGRYFLRAAEDIGVGATNDFIYGPLHEGLRRQLLDGLRAGVPPGLILADLPDHPIVRNYRRDHAGADPPASQLREWLGLPPTDPTPAPELLQLLRLEAPLAIQSATEAGVFPFNKFSAIPLAIEAERLASVEADGVGAVADARKRLVIVPDWHVQEVLTQTQPHNRVLVNRVRVVHAPGATFD